MACRLIHSGARGRLLAAAACLALGVSTVASGPLVIQLLNPGGMPTGKGWVEVREDPADESPILASHTDEHGLFTRTDSPLYLKTLYIRAVACPYAVRTFAAAWPQEKITVVLEPEAHLNSVCSLRPTAGLASICVRVRSPECLPLKRAHVSLSNLKTPFKAEADVDQNGIASFTDIPPGQGYTIKVSEEPGYCTIVKFFPDLGAGAFESVDIMPLPGEVSKVTGPLIIDTRQETGSPIINIPPDYPDSKAAFAALRECANREEPTFYGPYAVSYLEKAYWQGEDRILEEMMAISPHCDGAVAEGVGGFLSDVLLRRTKTFVMALAKQPTEVQGRIATSAAWGDGGGLPKEEARTCLAVLTRFQRKSKLKGPATLCKNAVQAMTEENGEWEAQQVNPPVPLTGMMVATACRLNVITVVLGPPGEESPRAVLLGPDTIITGPQGGRYSCDLMGATGQVRIWPAEPWKGWDSVKKDEPIEALVVVMVR